MWGWIGAAVAAIGIGGSFLASRDRDDALDKAVEARNEANRLERKRQQVQLKREKIRVIRDTRIKRGKAVSAATAQGAQGSVRGGFGSIISQGSTNVGTLGQLNAITQLQNKAYDLSTIFQTEARHHGTSAANFQGLANLGTTIFDRRTEIPSAIKQFKGIFS
jgi:hypothetical protein